MTNKTTLPELLPCPFCGGAPELIAPSPNDGVYVECRHCFVYGPEVQAAPAAIEHWNKRHAEQATANLRAKLEQCGKEAAFFKAKADDYDRIKHDLRMARAETVVTDAEKWRHLKDRIYRGGGRMQSRWRIVETCPEFGDEKDVRDWEDEVTRIARNKEQA